MSLAVTLMGVGLPQEQATRVGFGDQVSVVGSGTAQLTATAINRDTTNCALETSPGNTAFRLPPQTELMQEYFLACTDADAALIYPPVGGFIDANAVNASVTIAQDRSRTFKRVAGNYWVSVHSGDDLQVGTVTSVSVVTANGFAGSVADPTTTPAITLSTTVTGILKGNGTVVSAATQGVDYYAPGGTDVAVADGGTGLSSGTSGGVLGFTAAGVIASSVALTQNALVLGGGAGATPTPLGSLGTTTTVLHGNAAGAPTFGAVAIATDVSGLGSGVATWLGTPSSANLAAAVTGETGTGALVFGTAPTFTTSISFSPTTGGIVGTTAADNASAGIVGEVISSSIASGSAVALTTAVAANVTSISLTAGDWDVAATVVFTQAGTTSVTQMTGSISTTSATLDASNDRFGQISFPAFVPGTSSETVPIPRARINISSTTTVYLVARASFTVSTMSAYGIISARRVR